MKKNFTRKDLTDKVFQNMGFSKNVSQTIIDELFDYLVSELVISNKIKISSFGSFEVVKKKERIGRNPKTKEQAMISARKIVRFKPSLLLKDMINNTWKLTIKLMKHTKR